MNSRFKYCYDFMIELEGGYTLHHNKGEDSHTYAGIYRAAHPTWLGFEYLDAGELVPEKLVQEFYNEEFWDKIHGDELPEGFNLQVFCTSINIGVHNASILLQRVLDVTQDGIIGSKTIAKAQQYDVNVLGEKAVVAKLRDYCRESVIYYNKTILADHTKSVYHDGWINRAVDTCLEATCNAKLPF
jgi:lysozyme family protein